MRTMAFEVPQVQQLALTEHVSWLEVVADLDVVGMYKSCDHYGPKEVCQTLFRPWGQPWLQPLGSRLFEPGLGSKNKFFSSRK